jgi:beta-lactamase superfamily II metal-dependent hydrolase
MTKKDKNFLIFASLGALSLSILAIASNEGKGFLADQTTQYTTQCADIVFGGTFTTYGSVLADGTVCYSASSNISISSFSCSNCYKGDPTVNTSDGRALKVGKSGVNGTFTFTFSQSYIITTAKIYGSAYSSNQNNTSCSVTTSAQQTSQKASFTYGTSSVDVSDLTADTTATAARAYTFNNLDGGTKAASNSFTFKVEDTGKAPYVAKIVFTILNASAPISKTLSNISVTTQPTKSSYTVNENLDTTGLVITADYSDSSSADVTSSCTLSPANGSTLSIVGSQTVSVSYTYSGVTKTTSFSVTVTSASVSLQSIAVTTQPTKTSYTVGDTLDTTGIVVTASYDNGTTADVTSSCSFSPTTLSTAGTPDITVTYSGKTTTFSVTVAAAKTLLSITSSGNLTTTSYTAGQSFSPAGLTITANYSGNLTEDVTSQVTWSPSTLSVGDASVTGSYTYGGVTKTIVVSGITVTAASGSYMYTKQAGDHLQVFAIEQTGTYGDCTLFKYGNWEMLVDGGNTSSQDQLQHYLSTYVTDTVLDVVVLTHPHSDHYGGFYSGTNYTSGGTMALAGITKVNYIVDDGLDNSTTEPKVWNNGVRSYYVNKGANYQSISTLIAGYSNIYSAIWNITPDIYIQWLDGGTYASEDADGFNNNSVLFDIHFGSYEYVMVGDAQNTEVNGLMNNYTGSNKFVKSTDTVIFKACHHCSGTTETGNTPTFLAYVHPQYAWASAGIINTNGASSATTPSTTQHPYKNAAHIIANQTGASNLWWNGASGTLDMAINEAFSSFSITGEGRNSSWSYNYKVNSVVQDLAAESGTPLLSTAWSNTAAFGYPSGGGIADPGLT